MTHAGSAHFKTTKGYNVIYPRGHPINIIDQNNLDWILLIACNTAIHQE